jgi:hypothetical protein
MVGGAVENQENMVLAPPPPPVGLFVLPMPVYRPVPVWVRPPAYVAPPPNNVIYNNVHNTVVINNSERALNPPQLWASNFPQF